MTRDEATAFLTKAREADGKTNAADNDISSLDRHFNILALMQTPTNYFSFDDYVLVE